MLRICPRILIVLALSATGLLRLALVNYEGRESPWMTLAADDQANHLVLDPPKCRVLLTDLVFPSVYSKWRLNEVQAFMEFFYTDVLVCKHTDIYSNVRFTIDWEPLLSSHHLASYDILIFDPDYNYLQQYNDPSFNGTAFNHQLPAAYLLRLRAFRSEHVDIHAYDAFYHIFVMNYALFVERFQTTNASRHFIHFYPGGGTLEHFRSISNDSTLIPTQHYLQDFVASQGRTNPVFPVMGAPLLAQNERHAPKGIKMSGPLIACFTSLGGFAQKGAHVYIRLAEMYAQRHNHTHSQGWLFYGVGNVPKSRHVKSMPYMSQRDLDVFYARDVDAVFNLVSYVPSWPDGAEGFPLGGEAVNAGAIFFSTDQLDCNRRNQFFFVDGFVRVNLDDLASVIDRLDEYSNDRIRLHRHSIEIQRAFHRHFEFDKQSGRILHHIKDRFCPRYNPHRGKAFQFSA